MTTKLSSANEIHETALETVMENSNKDAELSEFTTSLTSTHVDKNTHGLV